MLTSNIMEVTLHVHMAVSVDIKMGKLNSRHADKMVCSCPRYCLFSSPEFILLLPNKVMPWGGGAYNHTAGLLLLFHPFSRTSHWLLTQRRQTDSLLCTSNPSWKLFSLMSTKIKILLMCCNLLCIVVSAVSLCCCILLAPCICCALLHIWRVHACSLS